MRAHRQRCFARNSRSSSHGRRMSPVRITEGTEIQPDRAGGDDTWSSALSSYGLMRIRGSTTENSGQIVIDEHSGASYRKNVTKPAGLARTFDRAASTTPIRSQSRRKKRNSGRRPRLPCDIARASIGPMIGIMSNTRPGNPMSPDCAARGPSAVERIVDRLRSSARSVVIEEGGFEKHLMRARVPINQMCC